MEINDLIEPDEWEDLPLNEEEAFARVIQLARPRFKQRRLEELDDYEVHDIEFGYMASLIGVARARQVEPFASWQIPKLTDFNRQTFRDFEAEIISFLAMAQANAAKRARVNSVEINAKTRLSLALTVSRLRKEISSADMPDWRRKSLLKKLDELEREITRGRVDLPRVTLIMATVLTLPGGLAQSAEWGADLWKNVVIPLAQAKVESDTKRIVGPVNVPRIEDHSDPRRLPSPSKKSISD